MKPTIFAGRQSQRYQNSAGLAGPGRRLQPLRSLLPLLAMMVTACASVDAQQRAEAQPAAPVARIEPVQREALPASPATPARESLIQAREAMTRKQWSALGLLAPAAQGDPLGAYPEYWLLRYQLSLPRAQHPVKAMRQFLSANAGSYLEDRLRTDWLLAAARNGDFDTVRWLAPVKSPSAQVQCAILDARHMSGRRAQADEALGIFAPGAACWSLFDQLVADKVLGWDALLPLLRDAIEGNRTTEARRFVTYLFEPGDVKTYDLMMRDPMKWLVRQDKSPVGRNEKELVTLALARLARNDVGVADSYLQREWAQHLPKAHVAWIRGQYAQIAALRLDPRAHEWYTAAGSQRMTDFNHAWRVRAALRQPKVDWKGVVAAIDDMSPAQQSEETWVYWKARGQAALGQGEAAKRAYASIADQFNFYGQLATEELGRRITLPPQAAPLTQAEWREARNHPGLVRAVQLFRLGWRAEAVPEWNFAVRGMNDRQLLAAAEVARAEGIYDRVVNTSERTAQEYDFSQRFIAPFEGQVSAKAHAIGIDPAWVYGLIRQESRFIMDARSHVGASGLMQLMPATAKWVAGKIGMTNFTPGQVNDFDVNTELGTQYLNMVLQQMDGSQMLASAGYNAGPGRPRNWRATFGHPVEGAVFAETIPFTETRLYVKHVMSNAVFYAALFTGQPQSLKERLGQVTP